MSAPTRRLSPTALNGISYALMTAVLAIAVWSFLPSYPGEHSGWLIAAQWVMVASQVVAARLAYIRRWQR